MAKLVTLENNGTKSTIDSGSLGGGGGLNIITGTANFDFQKETDFVINTISNLNLTNNNLKTFITVPQETTETSIDDFSLNAVSFQIENIIDNISFDIRAFATNNASGIYQIKYIINY